MLSGSGMTSVQRHDFTMKLIDRMDRLLTESGGLLHQFDICEHCLVILDSRSNVHGNVLHL